MLFDTTGGGHLSRRRRARENSRLASGTSRRASLSSSEPIRTSTRKCNARQDDCARRSGNRRYRRQIQRSVDLLFGGRRLLNADLRRSSVSIIDLLVHESSHRLLFGISADGTLTENSGSERLTPRSAATNVRSTASFTPVSLPHVFTSR